MTLPDLFPLFRDAWILHDDGDVIVIDKPSGLPTHETEPGDQDHAVGRLAAWLRERGDRDYLGIHQRLDKDTSGVLLFSRDPSCNKALAAEIEGLACAGAVVCPPFSACQIDEGSCAEATQVFLACYAEDLQAECQGGTLVTSTNCELPDC